jgi:hypothetical protein
VIAQSFTQFRDGKFIEMLQIYLMIYEMI